MVGWLPLSEPNDFTNLALQINHPIPFSCKPKTQKKRKKRKEYLISLSLFLSLSLSLSLSLDTYNERGCDDGFVDVKSVEVLGIAKKGLFYLAGATQMVSL